MLTLPLTKPLRSENHLVDPLPNAMSTPLVFLIFELLTGKSESMHPFMAPKDMLAWVRAMREEEEGA